MEAAVRILDDEPSSTLVRESGTHTERCGPQVRPEGRGVDSRPVGARGRQMRGGFMPPVPIEELRDRTRAPKRLVREVGRRTQRQPGTLDGASVELPRVVTGGQRPGGPGRAHRRRYSTVRTHLEHTFARLGFAKLGVSRSDQEVAGLVLQLGSLPAPRE